MNDNLSQLLAFKFSTICDFFLYLICAIVGSFVIRLIVAFYLSKESTMPKGSFAIYLKGKPIMDPNNSSKPLRSGDYCLGFFLGLTELLVYPILIYTKNLILIGSWLLFKTIHKTVYNPDEKRGLYNRYLFVNALILIISYFMCRFLI